MNFPSPLHSVRYPSYRKNCYAKLERGLRACFTAHSFKLSHSFSLSAPSPNRPSLPSILRLLSFSSPIGGGGTTTSGTVVRNIDRFEFYSNLLIGIISVTGEARLATVLRRIYIQMENLFINSGIIDDRGVNLASRRSK